MDRPGHVRILRAKLVHRPTPLLSRCWILWRRRGLPADSASGRGGSEVPIVLAYGIARMTRRPLDLRGTAARAHDPPGLHLAPELPAIPSRHLFRQSDIAANEIAGGTRTIAILAVHCTRCTRCNETSHYHAEA